MSATSSPEACITHLRNERVAQERWAALEFRLGQIDAALERLEKRIWVGVYGVACFLLAQMAEAVIAAAMR